MSASAADVVAACRRAGVTLATAESITAGLVAATVADAPGCSQVLRGAVVAYATDAKALLLGLPTSDLVHVVSASVASQMARAVARLLHATIGVATTGVAGPDWLDGQPPGTVWIAIHDTRSLEASDCRLLQLEGGRTEVRRQAVDACLDLIMTRVQPS